MLDGALKMEKKSCYKVSDVSNIVLKLGDDVKFSTDLSDDRRSLKWKNGKVISDYENFIVIRNKFGYNETILKKDIALGLVKIKGFKPNIRTADARFCREGNLKDI